MFKGFRAVIAIAALIIPAFLAGMHTASSQNTPKLHRMVIQVSREDTEGMNLALGNAVNAKKLYESRGEQFQVEIVAYGPGIGMLKMDSEVGARVSDAMGDGVKVVACENTMTNQKIGKVDMLPKIGYVKAGVTEIMAKQQEGWSYIRP